MRFFQADCIVRRYFFIVCLGVFTFLQAKTFAQHAPGGPAKSTEISEERYREVAGSYRCPTCTGLSVLESDAPFSVQIQTKVRQMLESGRSDTEIKDFFISKYGPWILRAPPKEGFGLVAWVLPIVFLAFGFLFLLAVFFQKKKAAPEMSIGRGSSDTSSEKLLKQFENLVRRPKGGQ